MPVAYPVLEPLLPVVYTLLDARRGFSDPVNALGILVISYALVSILAMLGKGSWRGNIVTMLDQFMIDRQAG